MLEWFNGSSFTSIVTIYPNNFTLNTSAGQHFQEVRYCMIGIDRQNLKVAIRPVNKEEIDLQLFPLEQLHKVSVGKGYVRISNKTVIEEIEKLINVTLNGVKFSAVFEEKENMLLIDLKDKL